VNRSGRIDFHFVSFKIYKTQFALVKFPLQNRGANQTTPFAMAILCLSLALIAALMLNGYSRADFDGHHVSQRASAGFPMRTQRSCPKTRARDKFSEDKISANTDCHANTPAESAGNGNMSACFIADDDSIDDSGAMADNSDDSSAPVHGLFSDHTMTSRVVGAQKITYPAETWFSPVFQGIYQSGAAPPSRGTNENNQDTWLGGSGGKIAVTLRIIGGELSHNTTEYFGRPEIGSTGSARVSRADEAVPSLAGIFKNARLIVRARGRHSSLLLFAVSGKITPTHTITHNHP